MRLTRTLRPRGAATFAWLIFALLSCDAVRAATQLAGLSLEDAIKALEAAGLTVFYSSDLIRPDMRITKEPTAGTPAQRLDAILAPFGLTTTAGPNNSILIVPSPKRQLNAGTKSALGKPREGPAARPLEQIVVSTSRYKLGRAVGSTVSSLSANDIEYQPNLGGDPLHAVNRLSGVGADGLSARAHMRGGAVDETLVRFDDLRLYDPFHLQPFQSVFSAVDPRIVGSMDVYTGGFPAQFGDRMSGVIDIDSIEPPADRYYEVALSLFNTSALTAGRFGQGRGEWLAAFRRSNLGALYAAFSDHPERPRYGDAFAKLSYDVSDALRITGNVLYYKDDVFLTDPGLEQAFSDSDDRYVWLRLDHNLGPGLTGTTLISDTSLSSSRGGSSQKPGVGMGTLEDGRNFAIDTLQSDWTWQPRDKLLLKFGGVLRRVSGRYQFRDNVSFDVLFATPGAPTAPSGSRVLDVAPRGQQYAAYSSLRYSLSARVTADFGIRWDKQTLDAAHSATVSPRLGLRYELAAHTYLRAALGRYYQSQAINELQVADGVRQFFAPQRSDQAVLGLEHDLPEKISLRVEAYEKHIDRLHPRYENLLNPLTLLPELQPDRILIAPSRADARGIEISLSRKNTTPFSWWVGYTRSSVKDRVGGADVYSSWDQPNAITGGLNWNAVKWNVGLGVSVHSGWPSTPVTLDTSGPVPVIRTGARNSIRVGEYRSVDLRVTRRFMPRKGSLSAFLEINNVFNRQNRCCTEYQVEYPSPAAATLELEPRDYLQRVPSLGFVWNF